MRDILCNKDKCRESIEYHIEFIEENLEDIKNLKDDIKNGVQRYPKDNQRIIEETYQENFRYRIEDVRAKYSLGEEINTIEEDFHNG